ncbi:MAG: M4 family metallopeptidase [Gammaproteobacteria bacterium]|nr:M4 family metallopeptidase [Gammaproteobacteria bacterium]
MGIHHKCVNCITPPHLLRKLLESPREEIRQAALSTLLVTERLRGQRVLRSLQGVAMAPSRGRRTVLDLRGSSRLQSAVIARTEDGPPSSDASVNRAFDGLGQTREFFQRVHARNSIDDRGMRLDAYVHRGQRYNNAFWDGQQMVFGDGDGVLFTDFTKSLDVIAHELTHGVTEHSAGLEYHRQPGALNESMSDVFGSLVKQWVLNQTADEADWLIGSDIFTPGIEADALRSLKAPGSAYDSPDMGKDPQPAHFSQYVNLPDTEDGDWGGVHINSGIPNKAFFLVATAIGGHAWEAPGQIWYSALKAAGPNTQFREFAELTCLQAGRLFGTGSTQQQAVVHGWGEVGIELSRPALGDVNAKSLTAITDLSSQLAALIARVEAIGDSVKALNVRR